MPNNVIRIHSGNAVAVGTSVTIKKSSFSRVFQCTVAGTGSVTASVNIEASINGTDWKSIKTFTLSGTTRASDVFSSTDPYPFLRGNVTAITGTGATVTLDLAV